MSIPLAVPASAPAAPVSAPMSDPVDTDPTDVVAGAESGAEDGSTLSHADALKLIAKIRRQTAKYQVRMEDAEAKWDEMRAAGYMTSAEADAHVAEFTATVVVNLAAERQALLAENVGLQHGLPDDLINVLKGDTREELEAHAVVLAKYLR